MIGDGRFTTTSAGAWCPQIGINAEKKELSKPGLECKQTFSNRRINYVMKQKQKKNHSLLKSVTGL